MTMNPISESFPRLAGLRSKNVVIKFGGNSISGKGDMERFSKDIALLVSLGLRPVIVHGGGPEITQEMQRRGMNAKKLEGLRITDDDTLRVATEVLSSINKSIVTALKQAGIRSVGMPGSEGRTIVCSKMPPVATKGEDGSVKLIDLGHVGGVDTVNPTLVNFLCMSGFVPIIYPICCDANMAPLNVNADTAAAHLASALGSEEMILVTDVPGIMTDCARIESLVQEASLKQVDKLIESGVVTDGMLPKVEACRLALTNGVKAAHMVNGKDPHSILNQLVKGVNCGTKITLS